MRRRIGGRLRIGQREPITGGSENKRLKLHDVWPRPLAKLTAKDVRSLTDREFFELCRLVYRRTRKRCSDDRHAKRLTRRLMRRRMGPTMASRYPDLSCGMILATFKKDAILTASAPNRARKWIPPSKRAKEKTPFRLALRGFSFVDDPVGTMHKLREIAEAVGDAVGSAMPERPFPGLTRHTVGCPVKVGAVDVVRPVAGEVGRVGQYADRRPGGRSACA